MVIKDSITKSVRQIYAITVKEIRLTLRYKFRFFMNFGAPLIAVFMPFIIFGALFKISVEKNIQYYNENNFILFLLLAYCVNFLVSIFNNFKESFNKEKIWQTFKGIILAPCSKFNILLGLLFSNLILSSIPIIFILTICYILYPIPLINLVLVCLIFLSIGVTFSGIGLIIGVFETTNESISKLILVALDFIIWSSCVLYPLEMFPIELQMVFRLNPFYYYFDLLRLTWWSGIDSANAMKYLTIYHVIVVVSFTIITPIIATYMFNKIYNKYGIRGY